MNKSRTENLTSFSEESSASSFFFLFFFCKQGNKSYKRVVLKLISRYFSEPSKLFISSETIPSPPQKDFEMTHMNSMWFPQAKKVSTAYQQRKSQVVTTFIDYFTKKWHISPFQKTISRTFKIRTSKLFTSSEAVPFYKTSWYDSHRKRMIFATKIFFFQQCINKDNDMWLSLRASISHKKVLALQSFCVHESFFKKVSFILVLKNETPSPPPQRNHSHDGKSVMKFSQRIKQMFPNKNRIIQSGPSVNWLDCLFRKKSFLNRDILTPVFFFQKWVFFQPLGLFYWFHGFNSNSII